MSTTSDIRSKRPTTTPAFLALLLARCVRRRRGELGLSIERAAELSGIVSSEWCALEAGWVPDNESGLLSAIAGTLESGYPNLLFIAEVSRYNQELLSNRPLAS
jgi:hypothetical protein